MAVAHWAEQYSMPSSGFDNRVSDMIVGTRARATAAGLVQRHLESIRAGGHGVEGVIGQWCDSAPSFETSWHIAMGRSYVAQTVRVSDAFAVATATQVALRISETGFPGRWWSAATPTRITVGDIAIDGVERVDVDVTPHEGTIRVSGAQPVELRWEPATCRWEGDGAPTTPNIGVHRPVYLFDEKSVPTGDPHPPFDSIEPVVGVGEAEVACHRDALDLIDRVGYAPWVQGVLRYVLVGKRQRGIQSMSGSTSEWPGVVQLSCAAAAPAIADALVHECTHQYFNIVTIAGRVDDGTDTAGYWSRPVAATRPIDKILVAYHAFANVLLFYHRLIETGLDDARYAARNIEDMALLVADLDVPLRDNLALTELGRALYDPLASRIDELALMV